MKKGKIRFKSDIWNFYRKNKRKFPWREIKDPFKILVSEIMLQQTQTGRVLLKYQKFIKKFPDFKSLAYAKSSEVLKEWSGLGYNRRALFLKETARIIYEEFSGELPDDPRVLEKLPGLGKATAASIIVFSKNNPLVFIETNIRRVFIHFFFTQETEVSDKEIEKLVEETLDKKNPRDWYWALMDYGAYLGKLRENPNRKSRHYSKQSKFEGSVRKIRGEIIKVLLEGRVSMGVLQKKYHKEPENFSKALEGLKREKIIKVISLRGGYYLDLE